MFERWTFVTETVGVAPLASCGGFFELCGGTTSPRTSSVRPLWDVSRGAIGSESNPKKLKDVHSSQVSLVIVPFVSVAVGFLLSYYVPPASLSL